MNGYTLMHEHITIDLSGIKKDTDCQLDCYNETVAEFKKLYERGVRTVVDVTNDGMGRNVPYVLNVEKETGIRIIQSTGFYKEPFLPERTYGQTAEEMAAWMIGEIREGIDGTGVKAGMIGEIGTSKNTMTETERKVFDAAVIAARETGMPIYTHTTLGTYAPEQAQYFKDAGLDLSRIVLGHIDLSGDLDYIRRVLDYGITIGEAARDVAVFLAKVIGVVIVTVFFVSIVESLVPHQIFHFFGVSGRAHTPNEDAANQAQKKRNAPFDYAPKNTHIMSV